MKMLTEVVHQTRDSDFEFIKDEHGQIVKVPRRRESDTLKITTKDYKGTTVQNEIDS